MEQRRGFRADGAAELTDAAERAGGAAGSQRPGGYRVHHGAGGRAGGDDPGGGGEHRLYRGADRGESGGDEPAAAAGAGRRTDILPVRQRGGHAAVQKADTG